MRICRPVCQGRIVGNEKTCQVVPSVATWYDLSQFSHEVCIASVACVASIACVAIRCIALHEGWGPLQCNAARLPPARSHYRFIQELRAEGPQHAFGVEAKGIIAALQHGVGPQFLLANP